MRLSEYPVVFTSDSSYFFSCNGKSIRILSVETGQVVRIISASVEDGGHSDTVTSIMLNPRNPLQLYSASLDGTIKLWDFNDAILLETHNTTVPISHMVMHESNPDIFYLIVTTNSKKSLHKHQAKRSGGRLTKKHSTLMRFSMHKSKGRLTRLLRTRKCSGLAISSDGEHLVMAARYKLHVIHVGAGDGIEAGELTENDESRFRCYVTADKLSCVAIHPTEGLIATGDEIGRITLWYCFGKNVEKPVTTSMHWHAHAVASLCFTPDGNYLLSGGEESVLVIWQLLTGHKQFLPRLGSEIKHITVSPDQALYAIGHLDNSVKVINSAELMIKTAVQGLKFAPIRQLNTPLFTGLVIEPRNGHVVLNGLPGTVQFYDAIKDQHILELEINPRNKVSRTNEKELVPSQVMHCAFSNDRAGRWMVTVDGRDDHETTPELYLKFWQYDDDARTYILNTRVDAPHSKAITSCVFNPRVEDKMPMAVTTSLDGTFKIWELTHQGENRRGFEAEEAWSCRSTGFYRDLVPHASAMSADGSLLAIAYGQIITIWNPYLNTLQGVLTQPPENRHIKHLTFVKDSPFLVASTKDHLYCWNLLTCSVWWNCAIEVDFLMASQTCSNFVVASGVRDVVESRSWHNIMVFKPTSPHPIYAEKTSRKIRGITFMTDPGAKSKSGNADGVEPILVMNYAFDLELLGGRTAEELQAEAQEAAEKARLEALAAETKRTLMTDIFGSSRKEEKKDKERKDKRESANKGMISKKHMVSNPLFDAPSHVMAPVSSLFEAFMGQLLTQNKAAKEDAKAKKRQQKQEQKEQQQQPNGDSAATVDDVTMEGQEEEDVTVDTQLPSSLVNFFSSRLTI